MVIANCRSQQRFATIADTIRFTARLGFAFMELKIGQRLLIDGYPATVVAIPATRTFDPKFPVEEWLEICPTGIMVEDDHAGLIYYPDLEGLRIEPME